MSLDINVGYERRSRVEQRTSQRHYLLRRKSALLSVPEKHTALQG
jgi:hypothetical protein